MPDERLPGPPYPGDDLLPTAVMIYDQTRVVNAAPADIWPWIVQLGKGRGGWYCPASWERWIPTGWPASRTINSKWQNLKVGDRIDDYGFSAEDYFDVVAIKPREYLVYRSERLGARFTWTLMLHEQATVTEAVPRTVVHLRFRGQIAATGLKQRFLVWGGHCLDSLFSWPMLAGLAERAEGHAR